MEQQYALPQLTADERQALAQMTRSHGWAVLLKYLALPVLEQAARYLERPRTDATTTEFFRGIKFNMTESLRFVYTLADVTNPFVVHYQALLAALPATGSSIPVVSSDGDAQTDVPRRHRTSAPVL